MLIDSGQQDVRLVLKDMALEHVKVATIAFKYINHNNQKKQIKT